MLGATFSGAPANTGDLFNPQHGVDPNRAVIRFATPDQFPDRRRGQIRRRRQHVHQLRASTRPAPTTSACSTRTPSSSSPRLADAEAPAKQFDPSTPGAVSGQTITLPGHGFTDGEAVTYNSPAPAAFSSEGVDVDLNSSHEISGNDVERQQHLLRHQQRQQRHRPGQFRDRRSTSPMRSSRARRPWAV